MYMKRALKKEADSRNLYLDCECGKHLPIPIVRDLPMTYLCDCGIEYDAAGWILNRPAVQS